MHVAYTVPHTHTDRHSQIFIQLELTIVSLHIPNHQLLNRVCVPRLLRPIVAQQMIVVPAEQKRLVPIRGRHQHLRRRRNRQNLKIAEVLAEFAGRHDSDGRHVLALSARFPPHDYLLAIVTDEADATDVLVLLVAVDDVLEEDRVDL